MVIAIDSFDLSAKVNLHYNYMLLSKCAYPTVPNSISDHMKSNNEYIHDQLHFHIGGTEDPKNHPAILLLL